jgi:poly(A) polymerase
LYLVGGFIRDLLLDADLSQRDVDLTTEALPDDVARIVSHLGWPVFDVGKRYGTIGMRSPDRLIEITTFRHDMYRPDDRHPDVTFGHTIEEDLERRDLTINSLALNLAEGPLLDLAGGLDDLQARRIRVTGDAQERFREDPLRLLRVVRLAAQLSFSVEAGTLHAVKACAPQLSSISRERIRDEFSRILLAQRVAFGLRLLVELDLMAQFAPAVDAMKRFTDEGKPRFKNVLTHTLRVVEATPPHLHVRLAALLHDVGKPRTFSAESGRVHFLDHERIGASIAQQLLTSLRYDSATIKSVVALIEVHMRPAADTDTWTDSAVRRFVREVGEARLQDLFALARADITSSNAQRVNAHVARLDRLVARTDAAIEEAHAVKVDSPIDGVEIMALTGFPAGPIVGRIKAYLLELVLDGTLEPGDKEGATARMWQFLDAQQIAAPLHPRS